MSKRIPLTQGKFAIVDDEDFKFISQWKWYFNSWCAARNVLSRKKRGKRTSLLMHRVINKTPKGMDTDHINMNQIDNRKSNLRNATRAQNQANGKSRGGSSKYRGVTYNKLAGKWQAGLTINRKTYYFGIFTKEKDAAKAYDHAVVKIHVKFARTNF